MYTTLQNFALVRDLPISDESMVNCCNCGHKHTAAKMYADTLGEISVSAESGRIRFIIPAKGAEYVHASVTDRGFIEDFINTIRSACTIDDILTVFRKHSECVVFEELDNGEFEYLIYFADGKPDSYRYCIEFEMGRAVYHRFTPADYDALEL